MNRRKTNGRPPIHLHSEGEIVQALRHDNQVLQEMLKQQREELRKVGGMASMLEQKANAATKIMAVMLHAHHGGELTLTVEDIHNAMQNVEPAVNVEPGEQDGSVHLSTEPLGGSQHEDDRGPEPAPGDAPGPKLWTPDG